MYEINTCLFEGQEIRKEVFTNSKDYVYTRNVQYVTAHIFLTGNTDMTKLASHV